MLRRILHVEDSEQKHKSYIASLARDWPDIHVEWIWRETRDDAFCPVDGSIDLIIIDDQIPTKLGGEPAWVVKELTIHLRRKGFVCPFYISSNTNYFNNEPILSKPFVQGQISPTMRLSDQICFKPLSTENQQFINNYFALIDIAHKIHDNILKPLLPLYLDQSINENPTKSAKSTVASLNTQIAQRKADVPDQESMLSAIEKQLSEVEMAIASDCVQEFKKSYDGLIPLFNALLNRTNPQRESVMEVK